MKMTPKMKRATLVVTIVLAGCWASLASDPLFQNIFPQIASGGQGSDCPGPFTGYAIMTNSAGSIWITPPAGTTNGCLLDNSSYPAPYASVASAVRKSDLTTWCAGNYVSFPVSSGDRFQLKMFVVSAMPTNNPVVLDLQITWH